MEAECSSETSVFICQTKILHHEIHNHNIPCYETHISHLIMIDYVIIWEQMKWINCTLRAEHYFDKGTYVGIYEDRTVTALWLDTFAASKGTVHFEN